MARGSRSSGGRSSFSGGGRGSRSAPSRSSFSSSRSSSSFSRGHSHYSHHHHTPRIHFHFGRRHYGYGYGSGSASDGMSVVQVILIFFAIIFAIIGFSSIGDISYHKESVEIAIDEYYFYQNMIDNAIEHRNEGYIVNGTVINKYVDDGVGKYYIVYTLPGMNEEFETFAVYSLSEVSKYSQGSPIELALGGPVVNENTESIDTDFKNVELEEFSLYILANEHVESSIWRVVLCLGVPAILIAILVFVSKKKSKLVSTEVSENTQTNEAETKCRYCGSTLDAGTRKCPNCGANLKS